MNYQKVYNQLIANSVAANRTKTEPGAYELHHIIPRCLDGSDDPNNLVLLTPREHYLAHWLLRNMYPRNNKLALAFFMMTNTRCLKTSSRAYDKLKKDAWPAMARTSRENGALVRERKLGIHAMTTEQRAAAGAAAGRAAVKNGTGLFSLNAEERSRRSAKAGAASGALAVKRGTGVHAITPEQLSEFGMIGGRVRAAQQTPEQQRAASAAGSAALSEAARLRQIAQQAAVGLSADAKPDRATARKLGLTRYYGSVCATHPELEGLRRTAGTSPCVACARKWARKHDSLASGDEG